MFSSNSFIFKVWKISTFSSTNHSYKKEKYLAYISQFAFIPKISALVTLLQENFRFLKLTFVLQKCSCY